MAVELKAKLQLLQVLTGSRRASQNLDQAGLSPDTPLQQVRGNLVTKVSKMLKIDGLLILTTGTHPDILGLPAVGIAPEAIARNHKEISMIVVHFPRHTLFKRFCGSLC